MLICNQHLLIVDLRSGSNAQTNKVCALLSPVGKKNSDFLYLMRKSWITNPELKSDNCPECSGALEFAIFIYIPMSGLEAAYFSFSALIEKYQCKSNYDNFVYKREKKPICI